MGRARGLGGTGRWDVLLPLLVAVAAVVEASTLSAGRVAAAATAVAACACLMRRRTAPLVAGGAALVLVAAQPLLGVPTDEATAVLGVIFLAGYALGRHASRVPGLFVLTATAAVVLVVDPEDPAVVPAVGDVFFVGSVLLLPWAAGLLVRSQARRSEDAEGLTRVLVAERDEAAARAVDQERRRIATELHDIVAHSLSVMVVQAGAAQDLVRSDPDAAERAAGHVQEAGRRALMETRTLLHLVRPDEVETGPVPGTAALPRLVAEFARSGLDVRFEVDGPVRRLPAGVDVSVYRIVEEALTNAVRHSTGAARVVVHHAPGTVEVRVDSRGVRGEPLVPSSGLGLTGMRERVHVFGGSLEAGPVEDGFRVVATLPVGGPE